MSNNFLEILELLEKESSTLNKIAILEKNKNNQELRQVLFYAIDERVTFGISKLPELTHNELSVLTNSQAWSNIKDLLDMLSTRSITGNNAKEAIVKLASILNANQIKWAIKIIQKDFASISIGASLVNKAFNEKFILDFRCSGASDPKKIDKMKYDADAQLKKNGIRSLFFTNEKGLVCVPPFNTEVTCIGRSGLPIENFNFIIPEINKLSLPCKIFDGEISVEDNLWLTQTLSSFKLRSKEEFIGKNGKLKEKAWKEYKAKEKEFYDLQSRAKFTIFEILDKDEFLEEQIKLSYIERRVCLEEFFKKVEQVTKKIELVPAVRVRNKEEALFQANKWIEEGFEGAVIKSHEGKYGFTKGDYAIKIKREADKYQIDAEIIDIELARQTYNTDGSFAPAICGKITIRYKNQFDKIVESGVGTGVALDRDTKRDMAAHPEKYIGLIVEVNGQEFSEDGILITPRINRIRQRADKSSIN